MITELSQLEAQFLKSNQLQISKIEQDLTCIDYLGHDFKIGAASVKFRKAKLTPKKNGLFVTLWKRNKAGATAPFNVEDDFDFYIIFTEEADQKGFYLFPKAILAKHKILTNSGNEGKRGVRMYPTWCVVQSKQAEQTKRWQNAYFINCTNPTSAQFDKFEQILNNESKFDNSR